MIEVKDIVKKYDNHLAVDHISFTIEPGRVYGFLGPNGAGKSTTLNIITGCLSATEGSVEIDGHDIYEEPKEAKKHIGYLPEIPPLYIDMTVKRYLSFVAALKNIPKADIQAQLVSVMDKTGLNDVKNKQIKHLSKGYRQRVGIAQAIVGYPDVIILDEPTVGLDPIQIIEIRTLITELAKDHTIILSSHILSEVSEICDEIIIIDKGKLLAMDTPENLKELMTGSSEMTFTVMSDEAAVKKVLTGKSCARSFTVSPSAEEPGAVDVTVKLDKKHDNRGQLFEIFAENKMTILNMSREKMTLEDIFIKITRENDEASPNNGKKENKK